MGMVQVIPQSPAGPRFLKSYTLRFCIRGQGEHWVMEKGLGSSRSFLQVPARTDSGNHSLTVHLALHRVTVCGEWWG